MKKETNSMYGKHTWPMQFILILNCLQLHADYEGGMTVVSKENNL